MAFSPAGVRLANYEKKEHKESKFASAMLKMAAPMIIGKLSSTVEEHSFVKFTKLTGDTLRAMYMAKQMKDRISGLVMRFMFVMRDMPLNDHFKSDLNSDHVKIILSQFDEYIDTKVTQDVFKQSLIIPTLHESVIVNP